MKAKSVSEFIHKLQNAFLTAFGCFAGLSMAIALILLLPNTQDSGITAYRVTATLVPFFVLFTVIAVFLLIIGGSASDFEHAVEKKKSTAHWLQERLKEVNDLIRKIDLAKDMKISSITIGSLRLEIEAAPQSIGIKMDEVKKLLVEEKAKIIKEIEENENVSPRKPKTYAFLEKRSLLTPMTQ